MKFLFVIFLHEINFRGVSVLPMCFCAFLDGTPTKINQKLTTAVFSYIFFFFFHIYSNRFSEFNCIPDGIAVKISLILTAH